MKIEVMIMMQFVFPRSQHILHSLDKEGKKTPVMFLLVCLVG